MGMKQKLKSIFLVNYEHAEKARFKKINRTLILRRAALTLRHIIDQFDHAADFVHKSYLNERLHVLYFSHLVNEDRLERDLLPLC